MIFAAVFGYMYLKYQKIVDARLSLGVWSDFRQCIADLRRPREVRVGQHLTAAFIAQDLRRAEDTRNPQFRTFTLNGDSISIKPGAAKLPLDGQGLRSRPGRYSEADSAGGSDPRSRKFVVRSITALRTETRWQPTKQASVAALSEDKRTGRSDGS